MSWRHEVNADRREQEQLGVLNILVEDAMQDTDRLLEADLSTEERVHALAIQDQLTELARIIARRQDRVRSPRDNWEWSDAITELRSQVERARKVRADFIGKRLARLLDRLPQELPGWQPPPTSNAPSFPEQLRSAREIAGEQHSSSAGGLITNEKQVESSQTQKNAKSDDGVGSESTTQTVSTARHSTAVGQNIDRLRKECGWSYDELAAKTGIDKKLILTHVNRGARPTPRILREYAQCFSKRLGRTITALDLEKSASEGTQA